MVFERLFDLPREVYNVANRSRTEEAVPCGRGRRRPWQRAHRN